MMILFLLQGGEDYLLNFLQDPALGVKDVYNKGPRWASIFKVSCWVQRS